VTSIFRGSLRKRVVRELSIESKSILLYLLTSWTSKKQFQHFFARPKKYPPNPCPNFLNFKKSELRPGGYDLQFELSQCPGCRQCRGEINKASSAGYK
jgi:hypothetical protein